MATDPKIDNRDDLRPGEGAHEYGDVRFADPTNEKYPIDTPKHIRAAWSYGIGRPNQPSGHRSQLRR